MSFRSCATSYVPGRNPHKLAASAAGLLLLLAGCGGGSGGETTPEQVVRGSGYRFSAPSDWAVTRSPRLVQASEGIGLVSVTRYPLVRPFRLALWQRVVAELDRAAADVARQQKGTISASRTLAVSGRQARSYDIDYEHDGKKLVERITFVLRGKTEYYLLCRYEGGDTEACERLLATFTLG